MCKVRYCVKGMELGKSIKMMSERRIWKYDLNGNFIESYKSVYDCAKRNDLQPYDVSKSNNFCTGLDGFIYISIEKGVKFNQENIKNGWSEILDQTIITGKLYNNYLPTGRYN